MILSHSGNSGTAAEMTSRVHIRYKSGRSMIKHVIREVIQIGLLLVFSFSGQAADEGDRKGNSSEPPAGSTRISCDNSEGLPPVGDQVVAGSCYAWAAAYYYLTYLQWQEYGWDVTDPVHQCSPAFVYNLTNGGVDNGASSGEHARRDAFKVFETLGCATMADMPYTYYGYQNFPSEAAFRNGMYFRTLATHFIDTSTPSGTQNLKTHLLEGNIAVMGIFGYSNLNNISQYRNTYCVSQTHGARLYWHEVTVIGFDDSLETADGVGAFRFVNSWSTYWGDNGFFWMSYEAVMNPKTASGYAMYATDRLAYEPIRAARIEVDHSDRYNLIFSAGYGEIESPDTTLIFFDFHPMSLLSGVPYPEGAMVLDFTDLTKSFDSDSSKEFFINVIDNRGNNGFSGTIRSFAIEDLSQGLSAPSLDTPVPISDSYEGGVATVVIDDSFSPPEQLRAELDTLTGYVLLTWEPPTEVNDFIDYRVYRDGKLIDSTTSTMCTDELRRHGYHQYGLSARFEDGESMQTTASLYWPFPFGIPYDDNFEFGLGGWEQWGNSGYDGVIKDEPVYEGTFSVGLQTHSEDSNILGRSFAELEGVDVEVWFNMEAYPMLEQGVAGCMAFITPHGENLGVFATYNGNFACIEINGPEQVEIEVLDSTVVLDLNSWYKHKVQYRNGKLYAMLLDDAWNVLINEILYVRDFKINMVVLAAVGLDLGWNYFDSFSVREWTGFEVEHFSPAKPTNKPYALIITEASLGDSMLGEGDEIAVFDGNLCVGAVIVDGDWPLELNVWEEAGSRQGFLPGNEMTFRLWHKKSDIEYFAGMTFDVGDGTFGDGIFSRLSIVSSEEVSIVDADHALPESFSLSQAYPNPFNSSTVMDLILSEASNVNIAVHNSIGQRVAVLTNDRFEAGYHRFTFDANGLSSGVYFLRAKVSDRMDSVRKVVLMK